MAPFMASCVRGSRWVAPESGELWSGALPTATTNTTTNTSAFNDTQQTYRVVIFIPQNYTCYQHPAVGEYFCLQMLDGANLHGAQWKPGLFTIQLVFTSKATIQIYILGARLMPLKMILQLGLQKACWSHQVERENTFLPGLTWVERHNLIS